MSIFPSDLVPLISNAKNLPFSEIISLCKVSKQFNRTICNNKAFWRQVARERLTTLVQPNIAQTKRALQVYERALNSVDTNQVKKYIKELGEGGYDIAVLNLLQHYLHFSALYTYHIIAIDAAKGAALGGYDTLIQDILRPIKDENVHLIIKGNAVVAAGKVGNINIMRKYIISLHPDDTSELISNVTEYLGQHSDRADLIDFLIQITGDNHDRQVEVVLSSISNDIQPLFDLYHENMNEDDIHAAIRIAIIKGRKEYFDVLLPRVNNLNRLTYSLSFALEYNRLDMIDDILVLVGELPEVVRRALRIIRDDNAFISLAALEKILPYTNDQTKQSFLRDLPRKRKQALSADQENALLFLEDYEAIREALTV